MLSLLVVLALWLQGIPVRPSEGGTVTGTVRTTEGKPAIGVRVAARARSDSLEDAVEGASLAGLARTDEMGRYRLEGVPPGRYTISAGRVDLPTYYPGTLDLATATVLAITPGSLTSGIDFTLADVSFAITGVSSGISVTTPSRVSVPLHVTIDGAGKVPVFADGNFVRLTLDAGNGNAFPFFFDLASLTLPFPIVPVEYRVHVENLPAGYILKTMTFGSRNLMTSTLKLSAADLPLASTNAAVPAARTASDLSITLGYIAPPPPPEGVRVTGGAPNLGARSIYLSGKPGIVYSDGTFEFRGVPPGKHLLTTMDNPQPSGPLGAALVVGDRAVENVELQPVPVLPQDLPPASFADERHAAGTVPLAGLRGQLLSEATQQPLRGVLNVMGASGQVAYPIGADGRFEIPRLLPGSYILQVSVFDYFTLNQTVQIEDKDLTVELRAKRVY